MVYSPDKSWIDYQAEVTIKRWKRNLQWLAQPMIGNISFLNVINI